MTALVGLGAALALASPAAAQSRGDTGLIKWPDRVPAGSPFESSTRFGSITFPGPYASYCTADTYYPSWGADDRLYSPFMDGLCYSSGSLGGYWPLISVVAWAVVAGDDPLRLEQPFDTGQRNVDRSGWDGRYASASLHHDGVWYYGSYLLNHAPQPGARPCNNYCTLGPFVGFDISRDGGRTWTNGPHTPSSPLFGETTAGGRRVKLGALHVVDYGKNNRESPDGKAYLVGHGASGPSSQNTWVNGDEVYLTRVKPSPETINDRNAYEYYAGERDGRPRWSRDLAGIRPLISWPGRLGSVTITYNAALKTHLMFVSSPSDGVDTTGPYDSMVLEAERIEGPWRMVHYLPRFGTQAYFLSVPSKFTSRDGRRMWLGYSANYNNSDGKSDPPGSTYSWVLREFRLETPSGAEAGSCGVRTPPRSSLVRRLRRGPRGTVIRGRARAAGCRRLMRVRVSVARVVGGRRCRLLGPRGRFGRVRSCRRSRYLRVRGKSKWRLVTRARLRPGHYLVRVRAVDDAGRRERRRTRRNTALVRVR